MTVQPPRPPIPRPEMTDEQCRAAIDRVLNRLDSFQAFNKYAMVNSQQIRDLIDPGGMWSYSFIAGP